MYPLCPKQVSFSVSVMGRSSEGQRPTHLARLSARTDHPIVTPSQCPRQRRRRNDEIAHQSNTSTRTRASQALNSAQLRQPYQHLTYLIPHFYHPHHTTNKTQQCHQPLTTSSPSPSSSSQPPSHPPPPPKQTAPSKSAPPAPKTQTATPKPPNPRNAPRSKTPPATATKAVLSSYVPSLPLTSC